MKYIFLFPFPSIGGCQYAGTPLSVYLQLRILLAFCMPELFNEHESREFEFYFTSTYTRQ